MSLSDAFFSLSTDPEFSKLGLNDQILIRQNLANQWLSQDPQFQALPEEDKPKIFARLVYAEPALEDKAAQFQLRDILEKARNGDTGAASYLKMLQFYGAAGQSGMLGRVATGAIANLKQSPLGKLSSILPEKSLLLGDDSAKVREYLNMMDSYGEQAMKGMKGFATAGAIVGFSSDVPIFYAGIPNAVGNAVAGTIGRRIAEAAPTTLKTLLGRSILPQAADTATAGLMAILQRNVLAAANNQPENFTTTAGSVLKTFGQGALLDFTLGMASRELLPAAALFAKRIFGRGAQTLKINAAIRAGNIDEAIRLTVANRGLPDEVAKMLPELVQDRHWMAQELEAIRERGLSSIDLRAEDRTIFAAGNLPGVMVRKLDDGRWRLTNVQPDAESASNVIQRATLGTHEELVDEVSQIAVKQFIALDDAQKATFQATYPWLLKHGQMVEGVNDAIAKGAAAEVVRRDFLSPANRSYLSATETDRLLRGQPQSAFRVSVPIGEEEATRVVSQKSLLRQDGLREFPIDPAGNAVVVVRNPATPEAVEAAGKAAAKAVAAGATEDPKILVSRYLTGMGFDGMVLGDRAVTFLPKTVKLIAGSVDDATGKITSQAGKLAHGLSTVDPLAHAQARIKAEIDLESVGLNSPLYGRLLAQATKGDLDPERLRKVLEIGLRGTPEAAAIDLRVARNTIDEVRPGGVGELVPAAVTRTGGKLSVLVPATVSTPAAQRKVIDALVAGVAQARKEAKLPAASAKAIAAAGAESRRLLEPAKLGWISENWLGGVVAERLGGSFARTKEGIQILIPGQKLPLFVAKDVDEAYAYVRKFMFSEKAVESELAMRGLRLTRRADGSLLVRNTKTRSEEAFRSLGEVADKYGVEDAKLSNTFAPPAISIERGKAVLTFDSKVLSGKPQEVLQVLDKFEDVNEVSRLGVPMGVKGGVIQVHADGGVRVTLPHVKSTMHFDSMLEARKWLREADTFAKQTELAARKGLTVGFTPGEGFLIGDGQKLLTAKTSTEFEAVLRSFPDPDAAPDIFRDLDPELSTELEGLLRDPELAPLVSKFKALQPEMTKWNPKIIEAELPDDAVSGIRDNMRALTLPFDYFRDTTLRERGYKELDRIVSEFRHSLDAYQIANNDTYEVLDKIFRLEGDGKLLARDRRQAIFYYMGAQTPEALNDAYGKFGRPSTREELVMSKLRDLLGRADGASSSGLAQKFGISWMDFEQNYMSRIRKHFGQNPGEWDRMLTSGDVLNTVFKSSVPSKLRPWFELERRDELLRFVADDDALSVMMKYTGAGHRKMLVGPSWETLHQYLEINKGSIPSAIRMRIERFRDQALGLHITSGEKIVKNFGRGVMKALGATAPEDIEKGANILKLYNSLTYMTNMGVRPMSAMRNSFQVFTTFAARFGNDWTAKAIKLIDGAGDDYFINLRKLGVISDVPPVVNEIMRDSTTFGKAVSGSLKWFKNADDLSRALAYGAVDLRFTEAVEKLQRGVFKDIQQFVDYSGLKLIQKTSPDVVQNALELVRRGQPGDVEAAKVLFASQMVRETMFDWNPANQPMLFSNSLLGKLFGQYGTYSAGYRANIYRALKNGTRADKVAFIARFIGNNLAIKGALTALGIKAMDFTPGMPAFFGGGPNFEVAVNLLQAADTGYKGEQARAELLGAVSPVVWKGGGLQANWPRVLPGSSQAYYLKKAQEYAAAGDTWRMWLALTTTPSTDP